MATEPRLTADFWVRAYLARLQAAHIPAYVTAKGDPTAGAVLVKLATLDGQARLYQRSFDLMTGARAWVVLAEGGGDRGGRGRAAPAAHRSRPLGDRDREPRGADASG